MMLARNVGASRGATAYELQIRRLQIDLLRPRFWRTSRPLRIHWWPRSMML